MRTAPPAGVGGVGGLGINDFLVVVGGAFQATPSFTRKVSSGACQPQPIHATRMGQHGGGGDP